MIFIAGWVGLCIGFVLGGWWGYAQACNQISDQDDAEIIDLVPGTTVERDDEIVVAQRREQLLEVTDVTYRG